MSDDTKDNHMGVGLLRESGWSDLIFIGYGRDDGVDIIALDKNEQPGFFKLKTSSLGLAEDLDIRQLNADSFIRDILESVARRSGRYYDMDDSTVYRIRSILDKIEYSYGIYAFVVGINYLSNAIYISRWGQ